MKWLKSKTVWGLIIAILGTVLGWWDSNESLQKLPEILQLVGGTTAGVGIRHAIAKGK